MIGCCGGGGCALVLPGSRPLRSPFVEFDLVDGPNGALDVLDAHETFVQRQVVAYRVLICISGLVVRSIFFSIFQFPEPEVNGGGVGWGEGEGGTRNVT